MNQELNSFPCKVCGHSKKNHVIDIENPIIDKSINKDYIGYCFECYEFWCKNPVPVVLTPSYLHTFVSDNLKYLEMRHKENTNEISL